MEYESLLKLVAGMKIADFYFFPTQNNVIFSYFFFVRCAIAKRLIEAKTLKLHS